MNPATPLATIEEVLEEVDLVQIMSVNPGFGGQQFIQSQLRKIQHLKQLLHERKLEIHIAVDGGIDTRTAPQAVEAGASILVAGSSIYNNRATVRENIKALRASVNLASRRQ